MRFKNTSAPNHVVVFKTYVQFVILLCTFVGKCDWLRGYGVHIVKRSILLKVRVKGSLAYNCNLYCLKSKVQAYRRGKIFRRLQSKISESLRHQISVWHKSVYFTCNKQKKGCAKKNLLLHLPGCSTSRISVNFVLDKILLPCTMLVLLFGCERYFW
jgi:hypothetical protein